MNARVRALLVGALLVVVACSSPAAATSSPTQTSSSGAPASASPEPSSPAETAATSETAEAVVTPAAVPADWIEHELPGVGVTVPLPPRYEIISSDDLADPAFEAELRKRFPDNPVVDSLVGALTSGAVVLVGYDFTDGATVDGLGTQITVVRYPQPISNFETFPDVVVAAIGQQLDVQGEPTVERQDLAIGPAARLQLVHNFMGLADTHDITGVQYLVPNGGKSFYIGLGTIEDDAATIDEFDLAVHAAHASQ